jgi:hypothetical protein
MTRNFGPQGKEDMQLAFEQCPDEVVQDCQNRRVKYVNTLRQNMHPAAQNANATSSGDGSSSDDDSSGIDTSSGADDSSSGRSRYSSTSAGSGSDTESMDADAAAAPPRARRVAPWTVPQSVDEGQQEQQQHQPVDISVGVVAAAGPAKHDMLAKTLACEFWVVHCSVIGSNVSMCVRFSFYV